MTKSAPNFRNLFDRNGRFSPFPDTMARRLTCKYPIKLWQNRDGIITCPMCGDTLMVFYVWQIILLATWVLDMGAIWLIYR